MRFHEAAYQMLVLSDKVPYLYEIVLLWNDAGMRFICIIQYNLYIIKLILSNTVPQPVLNCLTLKWHRDEVKHSHG